MFIIYALNMGRVSSGLMPFITNLR